VTEKTEEEHEKEQEDFLMALAVNDSDLKKKVKENPKEALQLAKKKICKFYSR